MTDEGARGNVAREQYGADDPANQRGESQRPPQQALLRQRGAAEDRGRVKQQHVGGAGKTGMRRRVRAGSRQDDAARAHQPGKDEKDRGSHVVCCLRGSGRLDAADDRRGRSGNERRHSYGNKNTRRR